MAEEFRTSKTFRCPCGIACCWISAAAWMQLEQSGAKEKTLAKAKPCKTWMKCPEQWILHSPCCIFVCCGFSGLGPTFNVA